MQSLLLDDLLDLEENQYDKYSIVEDLVQALPYILYEKSNDPWNRCHLIHMQRRYIERGVDLT